MAKGLEVIVLFETFLQEILHRPLDTFYIYLFNLTIQTVTLLN
jgi:hypothetical protein